MQRTVHLLLIVAIGLLSFFIVFSTHGNSITSAIVPPEPTPTFRPFPLITPRDVAHEVIAPPDIPSGFCLKVQVLMYHHVENLAKAIKENHAWLAVDPTSFDEQMNYLKTHGYTSIKAEALIEALERKQQLPDKSVVITLDDGYDDMYTNAFPIAKKYGMILNLMIPTGLIENKGYLTWNQISEMVNSGTATVYNHTWSHFSLPSGDHAKIVNEISTAQKDLNAHIGNVPKILTYPYGTYNQQVVSIVSKELKFAAAFSTKPGIVQCDASIMALPRTRVGNMPLSSYGL